MWDSLDHDDNVRAEYEEQSNDGESSNGIEGDEDVCSSGEDHSGGGLVVCIG